MLKFERTLRDGQGQTVRVVMEVAEGGQKLEDAIAHLANKARSSRSKTATALNGFVRLTIVPPEGSTT
jgi:hypothetical protein